MFSSSEVAMIAQGKLKDALYALNSVLVVARTMAFEQSPHQALARVLDIAELLPMLIARTDDTAAEFRSYLEDLVRIDDRFGVAMQRFDGDHSLPR
jgi:hypothetical protein